MDNKACAAAISTIEAQLEILKSSMGMAEDVGEEHHEYDEPKLKQVGRGRKRKTVPSIEEEDED